MTARTLKRRMELSDRWRARYRADPAFRLKWLNDKRRRDGRPLLSDVPPVGQMHVDQANSRPRDAKGRFL